MNTVLKNALEVKGSKFISITYKNQQNEVSAYTLLLGTVLENSYKKDIAKLEKMGKQENEIDEIARQEILASLKKSLEVGIGNNPDYTKQGYYVHLDKNVKVSDASLYLQGFVISKNTIIKGEYKTVKSSDKTIAKNKLRKTLRIGKFREFKLNPSQIETVSLNGKRIKVGGIFETPKKQNVA